MIEQAAKLLLTCTFTSAASTALAPFNETPKIEPIKPSFELKYVAEEGSEEGLLVGNQGAGAVRVIWGATSVSFVEWTVMGTPTLTTVDLTNGLPFPSVHSRHTFLGGLTPSQNYGSCKIQ